VPKLVNRQWLLASRPQGMVKTSDFSLRETPVTPPGDGQVLVRNLVLAFEPAMRGWMVDAPGYVPPVPLGDVMRGMTVGQVLESNLPEYKPGDFVSGMLGWQEYATAGRGAMISKIPAGATTLTQPLSVLGITGLTAYFGLLDLGKPQPGETVVVSGAAGATGSIVGQIAKIKGCRVVGIAGGADKCRWLVEEARIDGAIDYKREDIGARLRELCPGGIDVFFDNVGGAALEAVLDQIRLRARIVLCGAISRYNSEELPPGPRNYFNLTPQRARMEGFILIDYLPRAAEALKDLSAWLREGRIVYQEDIQHGFENAPRTFLRLFKGENVGKQLLRLAEPPLGGAP
jgi:NADPH-dependent curcumin reductase CurA